MHKVSDIFVLFQACSAARRECEIPFTGRCDRLHPSESFVWRGGQVSESCMVHSQCLCTITISVHQAVYVSNCLPLSLFISYKFVQDCHQLSEFQIFFSFFWKNPSWYVTGIFIYCMVFTSVAVHEFYLWWLDPAFIFIIRIYILIIHVVYTKLSLICL